MTCHQRNVIEKFHSDCLKVWMIETMGCKGNARAKNARDSGATTQVSTPTHEPL